MSEADWELLDRYLSGEATPEERAQVEAWLAEDPERWAQVAKLRDALQRAALSESAVEEAKADIWARLQDEIGGLNHAPRSARRGVTVARPQRWSTTAQIAAAIGLAAIGAAVVAGLTARRYQTPLPDRVAKTMAGQRATFRLPDGTSPPERYLKPGDTVEIRSLAIGSLRASIVSKKSSK